MTIQHRATAVGTAGEHIVCADLILSGFLAYQTSQGLPYDLIMDNGGKLLRIAVKSTMKAAKRPVREGNRTCYQFAVTRSRRLHTGKTDARKYEEVDIDIVALCALDVRCVAYCHIQECAQSMHFDTLNALPPKNMRGIVPLKPRKRFEDYTIQRALMVHSGEIEPLPFKWRSNAAA